MQDSSNEFNNYLYQLGFFWNAFNNLELMLRIYLNKKDGNDGRHVFRYITMPAGSECDENLVTDYKSFSDLCTKFNEYQEDEDKIDFNEYRYFRDALAHGRITADDNANYTATKYSNPIDGKVKVYKYDLSVSNLKSMAYKVNNLAMVVSKRGGAKSS